MGGSAILDSDVLLDELIPVVAELRRELHPVMGVRPYRAFTVLRTWSGATTGDGELTEVETEIDPQPRVISWGETGGLHYELEQCGLAEMGEVELREVDLSYTYAELTGGDALGRNQQFRIRLKEAQGQEDATRDFINTRPPFKDREKDIGWVVWLRAQLPGAQ